MCTKKWLWSLANYRNTGVRELGKLMQALTHFKSSQIKYELEGKEMKEMVTIGKL